jgi:hypothetical protein
VIPSNAALLFANEKVYPSLTCVHFYGRRRAKLEAKTHAS